MTQNSSKLKIPWKLLLFRLFVGGIVTLYGPYSILSSHPEPAPLLFSGLAVIGAVLILVGLSVYVRCVWDFAFVGPGDASQTLVVRGIYKFVRNPMYLGLVVILLGENLLFRSWRLFGYAAMFWVGVHLLVILYEERALAKQFGTSYTHYCQAVPRWIPKVHRYKTSARLHAKARPNTGYNRPQGEHQGYSGGCEACRFAACARPTGSQALCVA